MIPLSDADSAGRVGRPPDYWTRLGDVYRKPGSVTLADCFTVELRRGKDTHPYPGMLSVLRSDDECAISLVDKLMHLIKSAVRRHF